MHVLQAKPGRGYPVSKSLVRNSLSTHRILYFGLFLFQILVVVVVINIIIIIIFLYPR